MPDMRTVQRFDFRGGMSRLRRQTDKQVYLSKNMRSRADGTLEVRDGQTLVLSVGAAPTTGSMQALYGLYDKTRGLHLYNVKRPAIGVNDVVYDGLSVMTGPDFGQGTYTTMVLYKDVLFFSNGINPINYHVPATNTAETWGASLWGAKIWGEAPTRLEVTGDPTPPTGPFLVIYKDRLYVAGNDGNVYWSDTGLFSTLPTVDFPALNFQVIGDAGNHVTGISPGEDFLVAFTRESYHIMTGTPDDDGGVGDMSWTSKYGIGCEAFYTISVKDNKIAFLGTDRRLYILEGTTLTDIDQADFVQEYLQSFSRSLVHTCSSQFVGNELWVSLPKSSSVTDTRILVYNLSTRTWTVFEDINGYIFAYVPALEELYVAASLGGYIWRLEDGQDDAGTLIPIEMISRQEVFGTFRKKKVYESTNTQIDLFHGESVSVGYALNGKTTFAAMTTGPTIAAPSKAWGAEVWGASPWKFAGMLNGKSRFTASPNPNAYEARLQISGSVSAKTRIIGYEMDATIVKRDGEVA